MATLQYLQVPHSISLFIIAGLLKSSFEQNLHVLPKNVDTWENCQQQSKNKKLNYKLHQGWMEKLAVALMYGML